MVGLAERDPRPLKRAHWLADGVGVSEGGMKELMLDIQRNCKVESVALTETSCYSQGDRVGSK